MALAWSSWQLWASAAIFAGAAAFAIWRATRRPAPPLWTADDDGVAMRASRTTRRVRWSELRDARLEGGLVVLYGEGEREVGVPLAEAERLGILARLAREGKDVRRE